MYDWRDVLDKLLKENDMKPVDLANAVGWSEARISLYRNKARNIKNEDDFTDLANALNIHPIELRYGISLDVDPSLATRCYRAITKTLQASSHIKISQERAFDAAIQLYNLSRKDGVVSKIRIKKAINQSYNSVKI